MRILVVSDTHGLTPALEGVPQDLGAVDCLLHAGDFLGDLPAVARIFDLPLSVCYGVAGNCDYPIAEPGERLIELGGVMFLLVHGHQYQVKQSLRAIEARGRGAGARAVIFGHSHRMECTDDAEILLFNPGSPALPRPAGRGSCGVITVNGGKIIAARHVLL